MVLFWLLAEWEMQEMAQMFVNEAFSPLLGGSPKG